jgi:hypothetical protein
MPFSAPPSESAQFLPASLQNEVTVQKNAAAGRGAKLRLCVKLPGWARLLLAHVV